MPERRTRTVSRSFRTGDPRMICERTMWFGRHAAAVAALIATLAPAMIQAQGPAPRDTTPVVIRAARLIDGTGAAAVRNGIVVVRGERIVAVGREGSVAIPAGSRT